MLSELHTVQVYVFNPSNQYRERVIEIRDYIHDIIKSKFQRQFTATAWNDKASAAQALKTLISSSQLLHLLSEVAKYSQDVYGQARLIALQDTIAELLLKTLFPFTNAPSARHHFGNCPPLPAFPPQFQSKTGSPIGGATTSTSTCIPNQPTNDSRLKLILEDSGSGELCEFSIDELVAGMSQMTEENLPSDTSVNFEQLFTGEEVMLKPHPSEIPKQKLIGENPSSSSSEGRAKSFKPFPKFNSDKAVSSSSTLTQYAAPPIVHSSSTSSSSSSNYRPVIQQQFKTPLNTAPKREIPLPAKSPNEFPANKPPPSPKFANHPPNAGNRKPSTHVSRSMNREDSGPRGGGRGSNRGGRPSRASSLSDRRPSMLLEPFFGGFHPRGDCNFDHK